MPYGIMTYLISLGLFLPTGTDTGRGITSTDGRMGIMVGFENRPGDVGAAGTGAAV